MCLQMFSQLRDLQGTYVFPSMVYSFKRAWKRDLYVIEWSVWKGAKVPA